MRTRFLAFLARCFDARLTDNERHIAKKLTEARYLANELNKVLRDLDDGNLSVRIKIRGSYDWVHSKVTIDEILYTSIKRKVL